MAQRPRTGSLDEFEQDGGNPSGGRSGKPDWRDPKYLVPAAAGAAVILILLAVLLWGSSGQQEQEGLAKRVESLEARLKKLEFQHTMVLENLNKIQESGSQTLQNELAKLRKAVADLEKRTEELQSGQVTSGADSGSEEVKDSGEESPTYHTVQKGENLFRIGKRYGISVERLRELNDLDAEEYIHPGQKLRVSE